MIVPDLDDLVLDHDEDGALEEVGRRILSEGPWTTVAFLVRTRRSFDSPWEGPFLWLHRYQKVPQGYKLVSRFHTTESSQLERLCEALRDWEQLPS
ncbi:MAG: hypothetical protein LWX11_01420 [Firmicutes bacterium]|nr:hypothetical protein [Bacillota bacterium]